MKSIVMGALVALMGTAALAAPISTPTKSARAPALDSRIDAVTVFRGRALVIRRAETSFGSARAGNVTRITVGGLPASIDAASLQARCGGSSRPTLTGITLETKHGDETLDADAKAAEKMIESMNEELRVLNDGLAAIEERRRMLQTLRDTHIRRISHHEEGLDLKEWIESQRALAGGLEDLTRSQRKLEGDKRGVEVRIASAQQRMQEFSSKRATSSRLAQIDVRPRRAGHIVCQVRYVVPGANWATTYDARLEDGILRIHQYGLVTNQTGEDWDDVSVAVSTAQPATAVRMPELTPQYLTQYHPHVYGPRGGGWSKTAAAPAMDASKLAERGEDDRSAGGGTREHATFVQRELFAVYTAPSRANIPSNGAPRQVALAELKLEPSLAYLAAPRVAEGAYLTARSKNVTKQPLLAGEVRLFLGDDFVGRTHIGTVVAGDELKLAFGRDERVRVQRERIARDQRQVGVFTKEIEVREAYRIRVQNLVGRPIELTLLDQVPVSRDKRIAVSLEEPSMPVAPEPDDKPGALRWRLHMNDGAKGEVAFGWRVRYPVGMHVRGM